MNEQQFNSTIDAIRDMLIENGLSGDENPEIKLMFEMLILSQIRNKVAVILENSNNETRQGLYDALKPIIGHMQNVVENYYQDIEKV